MSIRDWFSRQPQQQNWDDIDVSGTLAEREASVAARERRWEAAWAEVYRRVRTESQSNQQQTGATTVTDEDVTMTGFEKGLAMSGALTFAEMADAANPRRDEVAKWDGDGTGDYDGEVDGAGS